MNDIKITFSIDLAPFSAGVKSMLSMVQDAGRQIQPLLNMQVKAPDFSGIDAALKKYEAELERVKAESEAAAAAENAAGNAADGLGNKAGGAAPKLGKHADGMKLVKREAMEMFGGISFAAQGIVQLASSATGGSEKLDKLSTGMNQGISAGFGLASTMTFLGVATGGTAVLIGGVVAAGITLLNFFRDTKAGANEATQGMDGFNSALRGATRSGLKEYKQNLEDEIKVQEALAEAAAENAKLSKKRFDEGKTDTNLEELYTNQANAAKEQADKLRTYVKPVYDKEKENNLTLAEVIKSTEDDKIEAISNRYDRSAEKAKIDWQREKDRIQQSELADDVKWDRIEAGEKALQRHLTEIYDQEEAEYAQNKKQEEDAARQKQERIGRLEFEAEKVVLESEKEKALASAKTSVERVRIERDYAIGVMKLQEQLEIATAQSEEEKTQIVRKYATQRANIEAQTTRKSEKATKDDQEESRKQWIETHGVAVGIIDGVRAAGESFWNEFIIGQREAADEWDAIWLSFRNTALQRLGEILTNEIVTGLIGLLSGASVIMPGSVAGGFMGGIFGFASGGAIRKPTLAIAGEAGRTEFFAPEDTFLEYARNELEPKILASRVSEIAARVQDGSDIKIKGLRNQIRQLRLAIDDMPTNVKLEQKGDDLFGVWKTADRNRRNSSL